MHPPSLPFLHGENAQPPASKTSGAAASTLSYIPSRRPHPSRDRYRGSGSFSKDMTSSTTGLPLPIFVSNCPCGIHVIGI